MWIQLIWPLLLSSLIPPSCLGLDGEKTPEYFLLGKNDKGNVYIVHGNVKMQGETKYKGFAFDKTKDACRQVGGKPIDAEDELDITELVPETERLDVPNFWTNLPKIHYGGDATKDKNEVTVKKNELDASGKPTGRFFTFTLGHDPANENGGLVPKDTDKIDANDKGALAITCNGYQNIPRHLELPVICIGTGAAAGAGAGAGKEGDKGDPDPSVV